MPSIDLTFLKELKANFQYFPTFIETGTLQGETTFAMEPYFQNLYTIEFSEKYYNETKNKYNGDKINFILGDSGKVFTTLLPTIQENTIFFLDGHWSSGDTGRSEKDCPLVEEVSKIATLFDPEAILIVDDYRLFGTNIHEDWSKISKDELINILGSRVKEVYHMESKIAKDDRLIIHILSKNTAS